MPSKTQIPCDCGFLQRATEDADLPVGFDAAMNEYFVAHHGGQGRLRLKHCPWCGGKAPESTRGQLFATIPDAEMARLFALTEPLQTVDDVLAALGEPDDDTPNGLIVETPARDGAPPTAEAFRTMTYSRLSDTAEVQIHIPAHPTERLKVTLYGKYIGEAAEETEAKIA